MATWHEKHSDVLYYLVELERLARAFAQDPARLRDLGIAAVNYGEAVRRLAGTDRDR